MFIVTEYAALSITKDNNSKIYKRELWLLHTALYLIKIYLSMKFQVDTFYNFVLFSGQNLSMKLTKGNNSQIIHKRVLLFTHRTTLYRDLSC